MQEFIETRFELLTLLFSVLLIVSLVAVFFIIRWRRANGAPELNSEQSLETD